MSTFFLIIFFGTITIVMMELCIDILEIKWIIKKMDLLREDIKELKKKHKKKTKKRKKEESL